MLCINLTSKDPFFNLATDEYLLRNSKEDYFILGVNSPSVIIGKHQVANAEAAAIYSAENNIPVIRRISGGGTVYHDEGNLNFTFICSSNEGHQVDFKRHTEPIIGFLRKKDVNAVFSGKSQIDADGVKISGNAEHIYKSRVLHHGTLLFQTSLNTLHNVLKQGSGKYTSRAVQSNRTEVTNLAGKMKATRGIDDLRQELISFILDIRPGSALYDLNREQTEEIRKLADAKYRTWDWNYGYGPAYSFSNRFVFKGKEHSCDIKVNNGIITDCQIYGTILTQSAGKRIVGRRHSYTELKSFLSSSFPDVGKDFACNLF